MLPPLLSIISKYNCGITWIAGSHFWLIYFYTFFFTYILLWQHWKPRFDQLMTSISPTDLREWKHLKGRNKYIIGLRLYLFYLYSMVFIMYCRFLYRNKAAYKWEWMPCKYHSEIHFFGPLWKFIINNTLE